MPTRKIADLPRPCNHQDHNPPPYMVFPPGIYEHTCPACGETTKFVVPGAYYCGTARGTAYI